MDMQEKIEKLLEEKVRPALGSHGGGVDLVKVEDNKVYVKLTGGCRGCMGARMTMKNGIEQIIISEYPEITEVIDATDHSFRGQ